MIEPRFEPRPITRGLHHIRVDRRPKYLALMLVAAQRSIAYRSTTLLSLVAGLIWVVMLYYLWERIFATNPRVGTFTWDTMRTYIVVAFGVNALLSFFTENRLFHIIRTGDIVGELIRPVDYLLAQFAQAVGAALVEVVLTGTLVLLLGLSVLHVAGPASLVAGFFFVPSVVLGFAVKFLISYLTALACFWTMNHLGLLWARSAVTNILSGALIPLQFFPDWLQAIAFAAPFQAIVHTPLAIYLGNLAGYDLLRALLIQISWVIVLWLLARLLWTPSTRALEIQGG
jgi:ABC-2 type transport system permease protein